LEKASKINYFKADLNKKRYGLLLPENFYRYYPVLIYLFRRKENETSFNKKKTFFPPDKTNFNLRLF